MDCTYMCPLLHKPPTSPANSPSQQSNTQAPHPKANPKRNTQKNKTCPPLPPPPPIHNHRHHQPPPPAPQPHRAKLDPQPRLPARKNPRRSSRPTGSTKSASRRSTPNARAELELRLHDFDFQCFIGRKEEGGRKKPSAKKKKKGHSICPFLSRIRYYTYARRGGLGGFFLWVEKW
jgi:outer membrane biosynthesis protein TonB